MLNISKFIDNLSEMYVLIFLDAPTYLSSQSCMFDSSLSEEMSQFDFSTGVQSFSISSQNADGQRHSAAKIVFVFLCLESLLKVLRLMEINVFILGNNRGDESFSGGSCGP